MNDIIITQDTALVTTLSNELFGRWISFVDKAPKTVQTYTRNIKQFADYLSENGITNPEREDVVAYREQLLTIHKPTTVQGYLQAVKLFFRWTASEGLYPNIADNVRGVKLDDDFKKGYLTEAQAKALLNSIDRSTEKGKRDYAIISIMLTAGLRVIEISRANFEDYTVRGAASVLYVQGKGHTERSDYVKLAAPVEAALREYLACRGKLNAKAPLFSSAAHRNNGQRMTTRSISRIIKEQLILIGINRDDITAHSLRHTCGVTNLLHDGTLTETQVLLRHKNPVTTQRYTHAVERQKNNSEERIAKVLFD